MNKLFLTLAIISTAAFLLWGTVVVVRHIQYTQDCFGYLKRAADANSIKLASEQLDVAIEFLEAKNLTNGYTSVIYKTPDEDIGFWYQNLKQSQAELSEAITSTSQLEKSNVLMKLRETLTDEGESGTQLTIPDGLSRYPNNALYGIWGALSGILILVFFISLMITLE